MLVYPELFACYADEQSALQGVAGRYDPSIHQVLAIAREPSVSDWEAVALPGFVFKGCDLIDETQTSALTNCGGGFPEAFSPSDLNECGLIPSVTPAYEIRAALAKKYLPEEAHADCTLWAIWRRESD